MTSILMKNSNQVCHTVSMVNVFIFYLHLQRTVKKWRPALLCGCGGEHEQVNFHHQLIGQLLLGLCGWHLAIRPLIL